MISLADMEGEQLREFVDAVVRSHGPGWIRFVRRVVRNEADAEDAVQEAVRRVLARNRRFRTSDDVRMYLGRAISNSAIELYHQRRRDRERIRPIREGAFADSRGRTPHDAMEEREEAERRGRMLSILNDALPRLPLKQLEALRLTLLESGEMSIRDAGSANGIPYSTLRHRSVQGIRTLRRFANRAMRRAGGRRGRDGTRHGPAVSSGPGRGR